MELKVGDYAWLRAPPVGKKLLSPIWSGPYLVVHVNEVTVVIEKGKLQYLTHKNRLKKFLPGDEAEPSDDEETNVDEDPDSDEESDSEEDSYSNEDPGDEEEEEAANIGGGGSERDEEWLSYPYKRQPHPYNLRPRKC